MFVNVCSFDIYDKVTGWRDDHGPTNVRSMVKTGAKHLVLRLYCKIPIAKNVLQDCQEYTLLYLVPRLYCKMPSTKKVLYLPETQVWGTRAGGSLYIQPQSNVVTSEEVALAPCSLLPTPCTLHSAHCTLHFAPCTPVHYS